MKAILKLILASSVALATQPAAFAQQGGHDDSHHPATPEKQAAAATPMSEGEIRKVDKDAKKLTIKHGELPNLGMPPMTMVFQVQDTAILDRIKPGDKIHFVAEQIGGKLTVTKLEPE